MFELEQQAYDLGYREEWVDEADGGAWHCTVRRRTVPRQPLRPTADAAALRDGAQPNRAVGPLHLQMDS